MTELAVSLNRLTTQQHLTGLKAVVSSANSKNKNKNKVEAYEHGIEGVNIVAIISSFIFAFAFSLIFEINEAEQFGEEEDDAAAIIGILFYFCLSATVVCSGYSTVSMTAHYFILKQQYQNVMMDDYDKASFDHYVKYIHSTSNVRRNAKYCVILSFFFLYCSIVLYALAQLKLISCIITIAVLVLGLVFTLFGVKSVFQFGVRQPTSQSTDDEPQESANENQNQLNVQVLHNNQDVVVVFDKNMFGLARQMSVTMGAYFNASDWNDFALWFLQQSTKYDMLANAWNDGFDGGGDELVLVYFFFSFVQKYFKEVRGRSPEPVSFYQSALFSISGWMVDQQVFRKQDEKNVVSWSEMRENFTDWLSRYCSHDEDEDYSEDD